MDRALSMNKSGTHTECSVLKSKGYMDDHFAGFSLLGADCSHEKVRSFKAFFDNEQWKVISDHGNQAIVIGATFVNGRLDVSGDGCAILPFERIAKCPDQPKLVTFAEMFAGGFSGWNFAAKAIMKKGFPIQHQWSIDKDSECREAFVLTHHPDVVAISKDQFWDEFHAKSTDDQHCSVFIHAPISERWWLTAFPHELDVMVASPPCPPWAVTNHAPGFARMDGITFLEMMQYCVWIRPRVLVIENIASITKHAHWGIIQSVFRWAHYEIKGFHNLNLLDQCPQQRERMILIAVDLNDESDTGHVFEKWPMGRIPTLRQYHAILSEIGIWKDYTDVTYDEMLKYCDVDLLPRDTTVKGHPKKSWRDLQKYRFRISSGYAACFMTSYGQPCQLNESLLKDGGLYGSLLQEGTSIRKFAPVEIAFLQGLTDDLWIPKNFRQQMKILGNCISVPHAAWGLINGVLMIHDDLFQKSCYEFFRDIVDDRIHAMNFSFEEKDGGFLISRKGSFDLDDISPTIPIRPFSNVTALTTLLQYKFVCTEHVSIVNAIRLLTGQSCPSDISMQPCDSHQFSLPLSTDIRAGCKDHQVIVNVPSRLILPDISFFTSLVGAEVVCILTPNFPLVVERKFGMKIRDVHTVLAQHPQLQGIEWTCIDSCGFTLLEDCDAPSCVFACDYTRESRNVSMSWHNLKFQECSQSFQTLANMKEIHDFLMFLDAKGILQGVQALGWDFVTTLDFDLQCDKRKLMLIPRPGFLPAMPDMIRRFLTARIFAGLLTDVCGVSISKKDCDIEKAAIKLWDLYVWKGFVDSAMKGQAILDVWEIASSLFGEFVELRLVIDGKQLNPDFPLSSVVEITTLVIKIHLITAMRGGGSSTIDDSSDEMCPSNVSQSSVEMIQHDQTGEFRGDRPMPELIEMEHTDFDTMISNCLSFILNLPIDDRSCDLTMFTDLVLHDTDIGLYFQTNPANVIAILQYFKHSGIERVLRRVGWMTVMEFVQFGDRPVTRLLIIPIPPGPDGVMCHCSHTAIQSLFLTMCHALSLPIPNRISMNVFVRVKAWGVWIFQDWIDGSLPVSVFTMHWETLSSIVGETSRLRVVSRGRQVNPDCAIGDFAKGGDQIDSVATFFLVLQLHGGGGKKPRHEDIVKNKNAVASFLLERGADLQQTSVFAEKLVTTAGGQAIYQIMGLKGDSAKMHALDKLAKTLSLTIPDVNHAMSQNSKSVSKKVRDQNFEHRTLCASDFRVKMGFFQNQDGSCCNQIETIQAGCSGICVMSSTEAAPWIQNDHEMSQDELAILVLGHCPATDQKSCTPLTTPAFDKAGKPVLLSTCLHQLGKQNVKIQEQSKTADVAVASTVVCALTIYKDEVDEGCWSKILEAPVKVCFEFLLQAGVSLTLPCAPWGRSWKNAQGKCVPALSESFQVHVRLPSDKKDIIMKVSGISKVYVTPKSESHLVDDEYSVIWLDKNLSELKVVAASCKDHFGLIRIVKSNGKKINRGIRFHKDKFSEMHALLKPGVTVPLQMSCVHFAKLAPTPVGATHEQVQTWLKEIRWEAKAVKPIGSAAWMIGAPVKFEATWASWNNQLLLLTWLPPKNPQEQKIVVAGAIRNKQVVSDVSQASDAGKLLSDPWENYVRQSGRPLDIDVPKDDAKSSSIIPRVTTGPIEDRFSKQDQQIDALKNSLQAVTDNLEKREKEHQAFQKDVKSDIATVKADMISQCQKLTSSFEDTLTRSFRRQDSQPSDAVTELKALILAKAVPNKKAKTQKPNPDEEVKEVSDDEDM